MLTKDGKSILVDDAPITRTRLTKEGYLVADVRAARTGIYLYRGDEVDMPTMDVVRVYRPPETVFSKETLKSFTSLDVTNEHPSELVDSKNWKKHAVGHTGEDVARDGEYVRVSLILRDQAIIDMVKTGKRGLSFGYTCDVEPTPGKTKDGEEYDAVQTNLVGNHLAVVSLGRAGSECRIQDQSHSSKGSRTMDPNIPTLRTVLVDGIPVQATDASAQVIDTLQRRLQEANSKTLQEAEGHAMATQAKDAEIATLKADLAKSDGQLGTKDAEIATLKAQVSDAAKIDAMVSERTDVLTKAKGLGLSDADLKGKTNQEVIKLSVSKRLGDQAVQGKSEDYVRCAFDFLSAQQGQGGSQRNSGYSFTPTDIFADQQVHREDPLAAAFRGQGFPVQDQSSSAEVAHKQMVADLESAWKPQSQQNLSQQVKVN
jgi:hypothetical protein